MKPLTLAAVLALASCSSVAEPVPACNVSDKLTTVIDIQCTHACVVAHTQPSPFGIQTAGSKPLFGCSIDLDDVETFVAVGCAACPAESVP